MCIPLQISSSLQSLSSAHPGAHFPVSSCAFSLLHQWQGSTPSVHSPMQEQG